MAKAPTAARWLAEMYDIKTVTTWCHSSEAYCQLKQLFFEVQHLSLVGKKNAVAFGLITLLLYLVVFSHTCPGYYFI